MLISLLVLAQMPGRKLKNTINSAGGGATMTRQSCESLTGPVAGSEHGKLITSTSSLNHAVYFTATCHLNTVLREKFSASELYCTWMHRQGGLYSVNLRTAR